MRRLLAAALLALAAGASAALPDALEAVLKDLSGRSEGYIAGRVSYDAELEGRMDALKAQLDALVAALPDSDGRKRRIAALSGQTRALKLRFTTTAGIRYGLIGRELAAHVAAVRALDGAAPIALSPTAAADAERARAEAERLVRLQAQAAAALRLGAGVAAGEEFAMRDAVGTTGAGTARPELRPRTGPGGLRRPVVVPPAPHATAEAGALKTGSNGPLVTKLQED